MKHYNYKQGKFVQDWDKFVTILHCTIHSYYVEFSNKVRMRVKERYVTIQKKPILQIIN